MATSTLLEIVPDNSSKPSAPTTFPQFARLAQELRDMIWTWAATQRRIYRPVLKKAGSITYPFEHVPYLNDFNLTILNATCRDSRAIAHKRFLTMNPEVDEILISSLKEWRRYRENRNLAGKAAVLLALQFGTSAVDEAPTSSSDEDDQKKNKKLWDEKNRDRKYDDKPRFVQLFITDQVARRLERHEALEVRYRDQEHDAWDCVFFVEAIYKDWGIPLSRVMSYKKFVGETRSEAVTSAIKRWVRQTQ